MRKIAFILSLLWLGITSSFAQDVTGSWNGTLDLGVQRLRIVFHIEKNGETYTAKMDSPDQGVKGIPIETASFRENVLLLSAPQLGMTYEGMPDGQIIRGTFRQGNLDVPLILEKGANTPPHRPQTPQPPYPYKTEDIIFRNTEAGIDLAGTLTIPEKGRKFPAVILLTGSGAQNRDEELFDHKPFMVIADHLTRNGIAVLRFDDRGTASSEGDYASASIQDFATDAAAALDYLKTRKEIDTRKIGLLGHSEGGQIAFITAGRRKDAAFIITLAGPGVKGSELLKEQRRLMMSAQGATQKHIDSNEQLITLMESVLDKYGRNNIAENLDKMVAEVAAAVPDDFFIPVSVVEDAAKRDFPRIASPELRSLTDYDPTEDLAKIKVPILSLNGDKDLQVPADMNLGGIRERYKGDLTVKKYPGLNHLFQHTETGLVTEYGQIEETISPEVLEDIAAWINIKTRNKNRP